MPLTHKEFIEALTEIEQEYASLRNSESSHERRTGQLALLVLNRLKRRIKQKTIDKYGDKTKNKGW